LDKHLNLKLSVSVCKLDFFGFFVSLTFSHREGAYETKHITDEWCEIFFIYILIWYMYISFEGDFLLIIYYSDTVDRLCWVRECVAFEIFGISHTNVIHQQPTHIIPSSPAQNKFDFVIGLAIIITIDIVTYSFS
jgi:hypothetical protein